MNGFQCSEIYPYDANIFKHHELASFVIDCMIPVYVSVNEPSTSAMITFDNLSTPLTSKFTSTAQTECSTWTTIPHAILTSSSSSSTIHQPSISSEEVVPYPKAGICKTTNRGRFCIDEFV